jgi:3',5'-nucleoside bisphosphate phosphatase
VIDLHVHTTASDGRSSPEQVVQAARRAGIHVLAVADHDTVASLDMMERLCADAGIEWVPGIEITAMHDGADVHVLGYFIDHRSPVLAAFLDLQRADRVRRIREMIDKLSARGLPVDADAVFRGPEGRTDGWVGRPLLARAMVAQRFVRSTREAFEKYLGEDAAAWVPRRAPSPAEVVGLIHRVGGLASLAHPGQMNHDEWIPAMAAAGLDALEAYYPEHSPPLTMHYRVLAGRLGLSLTGGSDFHGDPGYGSTRPGSVSLPADEFDRLKRRLSRVRKAG